MSGIDGSTLSSARGPRGNASIRSSLDVKCDWTSEAGNYWLSYGPVSFKVSESIRL